MDHLLMSAIIAVHSRPHSLVFTVSAHFHRRASVAKLHPRHHPHHLFRILGIHIHPHLRPQGPPLDYVALFLFAILSGIGINGFGEVALLSAGVYVANHHLPIEPVLLIAWLAAMLGGIVGWLIGWQAGRRLLTAAGPLRNFRMKMLEHSEAVYYLHPSLAIVLTPSWAAGIERVHWRQYLPLNAVSALIWALPLGLGAYLLGRHITTELSNEIGWVVAAVIVLFILYSLLQRFLRTPHQRSR
jgi:membrane protein DedA with SNARE-associated domain